MSSGHTVRSQQSADFACERFIAPRRATVNVGRLVYCGVNYAWSVTRQWSGLRDFAASTSGPWAEHVQISCSRVLAVPAATVTRSIIVRKPYCRRDRPGFRSPGCPIRKPQLLGAIAAAKVPLKQMSAAVLLGLARYPVC